MQILLYILDMHTKIDINTKYSHEPDRLLCNGCIDNLVNYKLHIPVFTSADLMVSRAVSHIHDL